MTRRTTRTRRSSTTRRSTSRRILETRAPKRGTLIVAAVAYIVGLFGYVRWFPVISVELSVVLLAFAGGLLLLGSLLRDL